MWYHNRNNSIQIQRNINDINEYQLSLNKLLYFTIEIAQKNEIF